VTVTIELRNSDQLPAPVGFSHVSIAPAGTTLHLAGQLGSDASGELVEGLAAQTTQALANVVEVLRTADARPEDLAKITIYVVGWKEEMQDQLFEGVIAAAAQTPLPQVPITLIGVHSLFLDAALVEVEAVAVITDPA
jgi:enamine deaminase RidA (YjgF/YER057c/UK114 family)